MSLIPGRQPPQPEKELHVAQFLVRRCGLSEEDLRRIRAVMEQLELRFGEAALRLGLATQADIDAAKSADGADVAPPRAKPSPELRIVSDPFDPHSERIRALRTELLLRRTPDECNVFAVASACAREGRSRLAAEIAIGFAQLGQPTLLVDADLRRPYQHALFGIHLDRGLADALAEKTAPDIQGVAGLPHLSLLTSGVTVPNPLELLSEDLFAELLAGWRRRYQHVVLDTPPAAEFSDGLAVARAARRVLVLVRGKHTPIADSREMLRRLVATQAQLLGSVLARF